MPLLALPAFITRRKETTVPESPTPTMKPANDVLMRFLTQGGATVVVTGSGRYGAEDHHWLCLGCGDSDNGMGRRDWQAREQANSHAEKCRAMPKPEA